MLCSRFLRPHRAEQSRGRFYQAMEAVFNGMFRFYEWSLERVLRLRRTILIGTIVMTLVTVWLFTRVPSGLLPNDDLGAIFAFTEAAQGTSFEEMKRYQQQLAAIVLAYPTSKPSCPRPGPAATAPAATPASCSSASSRAASERSTPIR
jgi:HAE1 family hydrophobic/amphiphilic exporter-1